MDVKSDRTSTVGKIGRDQRYCDNGTGIWIAIKEAEHGAGTDRC
jgi:hypothetical protein